MRLFIRCIATGFFTGYVPVMPGTAGSMLALLILWMVPGLNQGLLVVLIPIMFILGVWSSGIVEKQAGHDASIITIDEMTGMGMTFFLMPRAMEWYWWVAGFVLFRAFDIGKPFPAGRSQRLPGGWGIMMDDIIAGIMANLVLRAMRAWTGG